MRAVALLLSLAISTAACFPHNAGHRRIAKISEGAALAAGILLLATVGSTADCDAEMMTPGVPEDDGCKTSARIYSYLGLGLILGGLVGFIATVSTEPDDNPNTTTTVPKPDATPPTGPSPAPAPPAPPTP